MSAVKTMLHRVHRKRILPFLALVVPALIVLCVRGHLADTLQSQQQAERWMGESDRKFVQISAFLPTGQGLHLEQIFEFRSTAMESLQNLDADTYNTSNTAGLLCDAWSTFSTGKLTGDHGSSEATVIAVGGSYFDFHPMVLRVGSYLRQEDLMRDRIILDEALAWSLFGSADLEGLTVNLDGTDFVVAGVIAREDDRNTKKVSGDTPLCFVCYDAWEAAHEGAEVTCYELVSPEPVKHFSETLMKEAFPLGDGTWIQNTGRFSAAASWKLLKSFASRGIQTAPVVFPYWENAAIRVENQCALLLLIALLLLVCPAALAGIAAVRGVIRLRGKVRAALPGVRERILARRDVALERRQFAAQEKRNRKKGV